MLGWSSSIPARQCARIRDTATSFARQTEQSVQRGSLGSALGRHQSSMRRGFRVVYRRRRYCKGER